ncbi:scarecrow-like protein 3 [Neltuma alba]|uniref:scarecrow-like protein 3 n=1 Tax=Neltuma alba TaxID=207710 RepID=UPI0010A51126|nr:scarecrow-like protein 3 [Prosopis alba]
MKVEDRALCLVHLLKTCASYTEDGEFKKAGSRLECIATVAAADGDLMQRLATYFLDGLSYRLVKNIHGVPEALSLLSIPFSTLLQQYARKLFFEFCPFLKFSHMITNQAIVEAMGGDQVVHIIDLNACDAAQWICLLYGLKEKWQGIAVPYVKITGIHENKGVLEQTGIQLIQEAEKMGIPLNFYPIESQLEKLCFENLPVKPGEPLAISSVLQLHSLLAVDDQISPDSVLPPNPSQFDSPKMSWFLNNLWKLKPRLMVITEQESDNNAPSLTERLDKTLNFYAALFDCLEANVPKERAIERIMVERMLLGEEIKNIISCDGVDRKERHGKFYKTWHPWLELAGFKRVPFHYERMLQITRPLQSYGRGYKLLADSNNQCLFTCWNDLPLYSISAWKF